MKKTIILVLVSLYILPIQAELPSMCRDGTYAGGGECELTVDGQEVAAGLEPDDFFQDEEKVAEELSHFLKDLHDKINIDKKAQQ